MGKYAKRMAYSSMAVALGVTVMVVLGLTGVGTYVAPLMVSLLLLPIQQRYGTKNALTVWLATGLLTLILASDKELAVVYLAIFGWYPVLRPALERLPRGIAPLAKLALFNAAVVGSYALMMPLLGLTEEMGEPALIILLLVMGNVIFLLEDRVLIPRLLSQLQNRWKKSGGFPLDKG